MQRDLPPLRQGLASGRGTPAGALPPAPGAALRFQRHLLGDAAEDIPPATGFLAPGRRALASDPRDPRDPLPAAPPPSRATADPAPGTDGDAPPPATSALPAPPLPVDTPDLPAAFGMPRAGEAGLPAVPAARPDDGACQAGPEACPPPAGPATDAAAVPTCPPPPDPVPPPPPACGRQDGDASRQRGQDSGAGPSAASRPGATGGGRCARLAAGHRAAHRMAVRPGGSGLPVVVRHGADGPRRAPGKRSGPHPFRLTR
ncbi:hypothetical protein GO496_19375 [Acidovorax citrulli]|nr:hypothetical protein [Paracidovorax citrulli]